MSNPVSRKELLEQVYKKAYEYEQRYRICSQCTLLAVLEVLSLESDALIMAMTGFAGGIGRSGETCGAYCAGVAVLGLLYGRDIHTMKYPPLGAGPIPGHSIEKRLGTLIKRLRERFLETYGSVICDDIERKVIGRSFDKWDSQDRQEKDRLGGHTDKCPMVAGKAAQWVLELVLEDRSSSRFAETHD
jgi:C_GCAxxG_C_C family probable redox protein